MSNSSPQEFAPDIAAYNDKIATKYDHLARAMGWTANNLIAETSSSQVPSYIEAALDLGTGTGQTVQMIKQLLLPRHIVAVDASYEMLQQLQNKMAGPGLGVVHSTIEDYANNNNQLFDLITAIGSFEFVKDLPRVLGKLAAFLTPGGALLFTYIPQTESDVSEQTFQIPSLEAAFTEYYWPEAVIESTLAAKGLAHVTSRSFAAYQRGEETVTYNFVAASNPSSSSA